MAFNSRVMYGYARMVLIDIFAFFFPFFFRVETLYFFYTTYSFLYIQSHCTKKNPR